LADVWVGYCCHNNNILDNINNKEAKMCLNLKGLLDYEAEKISAYLKEKKADTLKDKELHASIFIQCKSEELRIAYCGGICPKRRSCKDNRWLDDRNQ